MQTMSAPPREGLIRATHSPIAVRAAGAGEPARLSGHFAVFDTWTEISSAWEGNFLERISPGAFRKTLRENGQNVKLLLEHGQDPTVGQKPLGRFTLLQEDETGARYEADLYDTPYVNELLPALRDGMYGASFWFKVVREDIVADPGVSDYNPKGLPERTIKEASVAEAGPVLWGAYPGATSQARSLTDEFLFRRFMDLTPERLREIADYWDDRDAQERRDGPCERCSAILTDLTVGGDKSRKEPLPHCPDCDTAAQRAGVVDGETRDIEDAQPLAEALALITSYAAEADEPADADALQEITQRLTALIAAEAAEPEDDSDSDEMNNSRAPEAMEARAAHPQHPTATPDIWSTSTRSPYTLTSKKETSWKLP